VTVTKPKFPPFRPIGKHCAGIEPHFSKTYIRKAVVEGRPSFGPCGETLSPRTGFHQLDEMLKGMNKGSLVVIAGSTGAGKTLLANQIFKNIIQRDYNCAFKTNNIYSDLEDALNHSSGRKHLVVYDELSIHRTGHEFRALRTEIQKNIDWAIVTIQSQRREVRPQDMSGIGIPMSPLYMADYVFHIRKVSNWKLNKEGINVPQLEGFKVKCIKNRCRENGQEFFLKLENRPFLKEV
jgi:hypothetical protein